MHNITKIKLFRILLRITYLPSLILLYPLALFRKKSASGLFFFFDRYSLGGAQRIHIDILKSIPEIEKQVFFTRLSPNNVFRAEFFSIPLGKFRDIHFFCDYLLLRLFSIHYFCFFINRHKKAHVFGANSTFFYDMLPFLKKSTIRTELLHNFTFGKKGMEFFGLKNYDKLTNRIIYDRYTQENIENQYLEYNIPSSYLKKIFIIEPGVDIPVEKTKEFKGSIGVICAGRGGPQKRIWLLNKIAEYFIKQQLPVYFHFAGTLVSELSEVVKNNCILHGEISDPIEMSNLLQNSDIALLTSLYEGFPMFIKESMAQGCIPVVTALPGNLMHLTDNYNSLLIHEIYEEDKIVYQAIENIKQLLQNRDMCFRISHEAYIYAKIHFNRNGFIKKYRDLFIS